MRKSLAVWLFALSLCGCTFTAEGIVLPCWNCDSTVVPPHPTPIDVDPIPQGQLRVLIIEDVTQRHKLTSVQNAMLFSTADDSMREFVAKNGVKDGFRLVDKEATLSGVWAELKAAHPPMSYPWVIVASNDKSEAVSLTDYPTELLNKYAGVKP